MNKFISSCLAISVAATSLVSSGLSVLPVAASGNTLETSLMQQKAAGSSSRAQNTEAVFAAEDETLNEIVLDDSDSCFTWSEGNANNGGWTAGSQSSDDPAASEHYANTPGASVSIAFTGSALDIVGVKASNHRKFTVSIDGGEAVKLDAWNATRTDGNAVLFSSQEQGIVLEEGDHTAVLTVIDEANEGATTPTYGLSITYIKVYTTETVETPKPEFPGYTIVEDVKTTTSDELFKIRYNGAWSGGGSYYPDLFHDGYEHYAHAGDSFEMRFIGSKFELYGSKNQAHGIYDVYIDGEKAGTADATTTGATVHQQLLYTSDELAYGEHTLKVELPSDSTKAIQIDYLKVYHEPVAVQSLALDKAELILAPGASKTLTASINPWNCEAADLIWTSSNPDAAEVKNGVVTAKDVESKTNVVITVSAEGSSASASCTVTVDPAIEVANAFVSNAKLLDLSEDYDDLYLSSNQNWKGSLWLNDTVNSRITVSSMGQNLTNVQVKPSAFINENGDLLAADAFTINWLEEVKANIGRGNSSAPVKAFPDKIGHTGAIDMDANTLRFAWIAISSTADTKPGTYKGTINVTADQLKEPIAMDYEIEIIDLLQPEEEATDLQLWQHPFSVANYYLGLGSKPSGGISNDKQEDFYFTEAHFDLMRDSMEDYAAAGGHDAVANIVEEAWNHQSYYNDQSMVKWTKKADGTWDFDYTWYDAWIEFMIDCGVIDPAAGIGQIKAYSIVPWNNQIAWYDEAAQTTKKQSFTPGSDSWKEIWTTFLQDYMNHSIEKGWLDVTYISMDERALNLLEPAVELIKEIKDEQGRTFKISSALNYSAPEYYDFTDQIDDISINLGNCNIEQINALGAHRKELGLNTTMYTCTGDRPTNFMISDPGENYWTIWYSMTLGTDGYMRWAFDNYVYDMHGNASYRYWEPGDGWFIYPMERGSEETINGKNFYSTPRYEMLKQGMRDTAKAKYLLASSNLSDEEKAALQASIDALRAPATSTSYGSRVFASESARMSVHNGTDAIMTQVDAAARLEAVRDDEDVKAADKTLLEQAISYADALVAEGLPATLHPSVKASFESSLAAAKAVFADAASSQSDVNKAWLELSRMIHMLEFTADKSGLADLVEEAEGMNPDQYPDGAAKDAFLEALENAKNVLESETALDESIQKALGDLQKAISDLEATQSLDLSLLLWLIQDVKDIDRTLYLENGLPAFEEALSHAQAVAADPKTQEEIDAAINTLTDAYLNLRLKPSEELLQSLKDFVALAGNIDASLFSADELSGIQALTSQISDRMISGEMDLQEAEALNEKAQSYTALIQERMAAGSTASTNASNTAAGVSKAPAASRSVKTAFSTGFASMAAAGLASLGGLLSLRRRKK